MSEAYFDSWEIDEELTNLVDASFLNCTTVGAGEIELACAFWIVDSVLESAIRTRAKQIEAYARQTLERLESAFGRRIPRLARSNRASWSSELALSALGNDAIQLAKRVDEIVELAATRVPAVQRVPPMLDYAAGNLMTLSEDGNFDPKKLGELHSENVKKAIRFETE